MKKMALLVLLGSLFFVTNCATPIIAKDANVQGGKNSLMLFDFEESKEINDLFIENGPDDARKDYPVVKSPDNVTSGKSSLQISFPNEGDWPGVHFIKFNKDWSAYTTFKVDVFNPTEEVVTLNSSFADKDAGITEEDYFGDGKLRYNHISRVKPGRSTISIDLVGIVTQNNERPVNLKEMKRFAIFVQTRPTDLVIYLDNIRLEKTEK